ncbi:MAG: transglycosylase SLT domain-containing protein, partial [Candidatus Margulisbacteria bacterium]|nr:transglycosylase SLT domain-containing protein [Candidatus Margulisiibacteriota bacterium]
MFMLRSFLLVLGCAALLGAANLDYAQAKKYLQDGRYDDAYRVFGYVGANRRHLRPYCDYYRALASYQTGQITRAAAILERHTAQENIPYLDESLELLNDCYLALDRAPEIHPLAAYKKVVKLFAKSQYPEALRLLEAVSANAQLDALPEDVYYYQARAYMYCAEPDQARRILLARADAGAVYYLGVLALQTRQTALALQRFNEVVQKYPAAEYAPQALYNLARQTRGENSLRYYRRLAADYPASRYADDAAWEVGSLYFRQKNYQRAAEVFLAGYGLDRYSDNADSLLYWAGKCYQKLGRVQDAALIFQQAAREFPARFYGWRAAQQLGITPVIPSDNVQLADIKPQTDRALLELVKLGEYGDALAEAKLLTDRNKQERISTALRIYLAHSAYKSGSYLDAINLSAGVLADAEKNHDHTVLAPPELWQISFPRVHAALVRANAAKNELPDNLIYALIREESRFDEDALSPASAYGLMQLIPATALQVMRQERIAADGFAAEILYRPDLNILLGTAYLRQMLEQFNGSQYLALAAYNAGPTAAARWLRQHGGWKDFDADVFIES